MRTLGVVLCGLGLFAGCAIDSNDEATAVDQSEDEWEITRGGELDGDAHPAVVLILMEVNGEPMYRCSGTLISPDTVLTAGHCTGEQGEFSGMRVFLQTDLHVGNNNFPFAGPNSVEALDWFTHPEYTSPLFWLHDVGVIKLAAPVELPDDAYGVLPALNSLDSMRPSKAARFTAVGYGVQRINNAMIVADLVRMRAAPSLIQINTSFTGPQSVLLSNNASSGGTCFGDSGGPNYVGTTRVIGGVTSFGLNGTCSGTGGVFRMDRRDVLDFVHEVSGI